jgi:hypothetical protein
MTVAPTVTPIKVLAAPAHQTGKWWLLLRWIYGKGMFARGTMARLIGAGIAVSFALDFLGIVAAWVLPGGLWVC